MIGSLLKTYLLNVNSWCINTIGRVRMMLFISEMSFSLLKTNALHFFIHQLAKYESLVTRCVNPIFSINPNSFRKLMNLNVYMYFAIILLYIFNVEVSCNDDEYDSKHYYDICFSFLFFNSCLHFS